ncbi:MAG: LysM peptidoglycan-binding domain-containing protein [Anaerolineae bacterium]|nr:LysM peptidoglycan-binding domain-containing protein [Anaerolineae bacterium]
MVRLVWCYLLIIFGGLLLTGCDLSRPQDAAGDIEAFVPPAVAQTNTVIGLQPSTQQLNMGERGNVDLTVANITNLFGFEIGLQFDPNLIQIQDMDPTKEGVQIQPGDFLSPDLVQSNIADNTTGNILYVVTQVAPSPPASGSGVLATITFQAVAEGVSNLTLPTVKLGDPNGQPITADVQPGQVIVGEGAGQPTPTFTVTFTPIPGEPTPTPTIPAIDTPTPTSIPLIPTATPTISPSPAPTITPIPPITNIPPGATVGFCYRVQEGETLYGIAQKFGVNAHFLNLVNDLYPPGYVFTHQALFIPEQCGGGPNVYVVKAGDTLIRIADQCHLPVSFLAWTNGLPETAVLPEGHVLEIPLPPFSPPSRYPYPPPGPPPVAPPPGGCAACSSNW